MARTSFHRGTRTVPRRLSNRASRPPCGLKCRHRRPRSLDRSGLRGRAAGRKSDRSWLLQHRHGTGLHFSEASVYWHLRTFPSRKAAEAAKSATGLVVEEDGECGSPNSGPEILPRGEVKPSPSSDQCSFRSKELRCGSLLCCDAARRQFEGAYTPGPEGWYVLAGGQCLETPAGANKARAGGTMTVRPNTPMELNVTGTTLRRAFALVIHDAAQERGIPSDWKPSGACNQ